MAANALAPCATRSPAAMVLIIKARGLHVFHKKGFQLLFMWNLEVSAAKLYQVKIYIHASSEQFEHIKG